MPGGKGGGVPNQGGGGGERTTRNVGDGGRRPPGPPGGAGRRSAASLRPPRRPPDDGGAALTPAPPAAAATGAALGALSARGPRARGGSARPRRSAPRSPRSFARGGVAPQFRVVSNPEFLKEGAAIDDFARPDRIVIGADSEDAVEVMRELYAPFERNHPKLLVMDIRSAELTKYAANAMLATRISFMNELALPGRARRRRHRRRAPRHRQRPAHRPPLPLRRLRLRRLVLPEGREGAAAHRRADRPSPLGVLRAVEGGQPAPEAGADPQDRGPLRCRLTGRVFALWGLAFKPETDDMREAPSLVVIDELLRRGAKVRAFDPVATESARRLLGAPENLAYAPHAMAALAGADALIVVTEWNEFRSPDFEHMKSIMRQPVVFDGRNIYDPAVLRRHGFEYIGIGRR